MSADRTFHYAVAASLALHALALFGSLPVWRESLREPAPPSAPLLTHLAEPPSPVPTPPQPREKQPPQRRELAREAPAPAPTPEKAVAATPPAPEPASAPAASAPSLPEGPPVDTRAAEAVTAAQYRLLLIDAARRYKPPYPAIARENNWIGNVTLDVLIHADGRAEVSMRRSSGYEILDRMALDTFQQAVRAVPVPPALQGKQVKLAPLVVVYNLTE
jgi:protein TonB